MLPQYTFPTTRTSLSSTLLLVMLPALLITSPGLDAKPRHRVGAETTFDGYEVARWTAGRIVVLDHGHDAATIRETVDDFNAVLPESGPELVIDPQPKQTCDQTAPPDDGQIVVCSNDAYAAGSRGDQAGNIVAGTLYLGSGGNVENNVCHELMHIISGVPDDYDVRSAGTRDSCVHGNGGDLGSWDVALLQSLYAAPQISPTDPDPDRDTHKHKKHRKHRRHR